MAIDSAQVLNQIAAFFRKLSARQRVMLAGSVAVVIGLLYGFVTLMGSGEYQPLYSGLSMDEGTTLVQHLAVRGIPARLSSDGTSLSVPAGQMEKARLDLAADGLPRSAHMGFELFDKPNWAGSDFVEQVNYQRALEGELEKTIESLNGVEAVRVHLAMARDSLFSEQQRDAKAAVMVRLHPSFRLSDDDLNAITFLVSNAVDNMKPEDVRVINADGHVPLLSHGGVHLQEAQDMEAALSEKLVNTLSPLVGNDQVRAGVTVEYENGTNETTQETYDPNNSAVFNSQMTGDEVAFATTAQGVPGSTSNVPQAQAQQPAEPATAPAAATPPAGGLRSESKTFGVGRTSRHTVLPPGGIRRISAAIVVDDVVETEVRGGKKVETRRKRTPEEMKQIEALAAAAVGINPARGDQLAVENMSFSATSTDNPAPPTLAQRLPGMVNHWMPVLRYVGLAIIFALMYLLILKPLKKQLSATLREMPARITAATPALAPAGSTGAPGLPPVQAGLLEAGSGTQAACQTLVHDSISALIEALSQKVSNEPTETSRLVQDWLRQR